MKDSGRADAVYFVDIVQEAAGHPGAQWKDAGDSVDRRAAGMSVGQPKLEHPRDQGGFNIPSGTVIIESEVGAEERGFRRESTHC